MDDKVIVTHRGALAGKYGAKGLASIHAAVKTLIAADEKRGIKTRLVHLDDTGAMKKLGAKPLVNVNDCKAAKVAIDSVFKKLKPDYLMILGARDVVPHQDLRNPVYKAGDDDDKVAWGDVPYACDTAYARDPAKFVGPTRVVSRLPDLTGAKNPSHLLALLKTATRWKSRDAKDYASHFGLSADVWQGSTRLSLQNIFGNDGSLLLSPPKGPRFRGKLGARMHFINCHGDDSIPEFSGQRGNKYPVCLTTRTTTRAIKEGAVASVECCYGAQLYDSVTLAIDIPICQSYLRQGAYGYLGSTTIAYGPADGNGAADLVCQYFLLNVLGGASIGRAALMAQQQFVQTTAQMDPIDLKTLAQFCVYGDPSVHPVEAEETPAPKGAKAETTERFRRRERRDKLKRTGEFLEETKATASIPLKQAKTPAKAKTTLANIAAKSGLTRKQQFTAFKVKGAKPAAKGAEAKRASAPSRYYVAVGTPKSKAKDDGYLVAVLAKEVGGQIIDYRIYHER